MAKVGLDEVGQLLLRLEQDPDAEDSDSDDEFARQIRSMASSGIPGSSSSGIRGKAAAAMARLERGKAGKQSKSSRAEDQMDMRFRFLKKVYGDSALSFDARNPDPGCETEVQYYHQLCGGMFVPAALRGTLQVSGPL
jgi:hypothetical protein